VVSLLDSAAELLSPPTQCEANLRYRAKLVNSTLAEPAIIPDLLALSSKDIAWTFNTLFWTKNPRVAPSEQPFCLYPHELDLLNQLDEHLQAGKDLLIDKTRDMGVTWSVLGWLLWHWRFDSSFNAIVGSRLEDLIDEKGNLDTHFERFRWLLRRMPEWWLPHQFDEAKHLNMAFSERRHIPFMRLLRPDNDNTIVGEAVTEDFSRQGRYNVAFLDEFAACDAAEGAWTATADSAPMRVPVSTPKGLGNKFAQLRRSGTIDVLSLHWSRHPDKAQGLYCDTHQAKPALITCAWPKCQLRSLWYDAECSRREPTEIAQELDIDYLGSGNPYFDLRAVERQVADEPLVRGFLVEVDLGIELRPHEQGLWSIWELPPPKLPNQSYPAVLSVIGADVAEGIGGDYSAAVIRDARDRGVKATLRAHLDTDEFAHELMKAGRFYHNARILCERNGPGFAVNADLVKSYGNVYYETPVDKVGVPQSKRFGWPTNVKTKELVLTQLREEIRGYAVALRDKRLIEECKTFIVDEDGKVHADGGYHDDLIMACALSGQGIQLLGTLRQPRKAPRPLGQSAGTNLAG
jgi:hypothetical protein